MCTTVGAHRKHIYIYIQPPMSWPAPPNAQKSCSTQPTSHMYREKGIENIIFLCLPGSDQMSINGVIHISRFPPSQPGFELCCFHKCHWSQSQFPFLHKTHSHNRETGSLGKSHRDALSWCLLPCR